MEKYILELISENNRVIIPNFGAFIVSKEHGVSILFNNFLSFNDGLLVNYIAEQKGVDTIVATDQVFDFVDKLKTELDESGTYSIDKLGTFKKDDNGILRFQQAEDFTTLFDQEAVDTANSDTESVKDKEEESAKKVFILDVEKEDKTTPAEPIAKLPVAEKKAEVIERKPESTKTIITPPPVVNNPIQDKAEDKGRVQLKKPEPASPITKTKSNRGIAVFIIAVVIIILAFGAYYLFFAKKSAEPKAKVVPMTVIKKPISKPIVKDSIVIIPKVEKPKPIVKPKSTGNQAKKGRYYVIVGGFKEINYAFKMVDELKSKGYTNAQMITNNSMHLVSIDSDTSYKKVEAKQQEILNAKIESWLYRVK